MNSLLKHDYMPFIQHEFKENTSVLVVHVSSRNRKSGTFDKYPVPDIVSNLYINVCNKSWYLNGLPCFEEGRKGTISYLKEIIETNGFKRVIFVGSSMGAFGSYLFANNIENSEVIAFGPELILNVYSGYSNSDVSNDNLIQPFFENRSCLKRCYIFAGLNQPSDVVCALLASHKIGAKSYILKHVGHATAKFLKEKENLLAKLIDSVINDKLTIISDLLKEYQISDELLRLLESIADFDFNETTLDVFVDIVKSHLNTRDCIDLSYILYKRSPESCIKLLDDAKNRFGEIAEFDYLYAQALFHNRDYSNSKIILDKLKTNSFYQGAAFQLHIKILKREKNLNEAFALSKDFESNLSNMINTVKIEIENLSQNTKEIEVKKNDDNFPEKIDYQLRISQLLQKNDLLADDYFQMIQAYRNLGDYEKAEDAAFRGIEKFPDQTKILSEWAWNAQVQNNFEEAKERLELLINILEPNVSEKIYSRLLSTYKKLNQLEELEILIKKALEKYPNSEKIKAFLTLKEKDNLSEDYEIIVLTTFPKHASNNVGDQLITYSFLKLLQKRLPELKYHLEFRANNLDQYVHKNIKYILAPGFSVSNEVYPKIYGLYSNLDDLPKFLAIGCSFQHISPSHEVFESNKYNDSDKDFFNKIKKKMKHPFLCRDALITNMLTQNGIESLYSGDMAIYDEDYLNKQFIAPKNIRSIVFTIGHHEKYEYQSYYLLTLVKNNFPNAKLYVSYHSKINTYSKKIGNFALSLGYEEVLMFGDVKNLEFYNDMDLHIGYRLHGHISFLRRRKPSVLFVEDARSYGFANTQGTHIGCFNALNLDASIRDLAPLEAMNFLQNQIDNQFEIYNELFSFVDKTYNNTLLPALDVLVSELEK